MTSLAHPRLMLKNRHCSQNRYVLHPGRTNQQCCWSFCTSQVASCCNLRAIWSLHQQSTPPCRLSHQPLTNLCEHEGRSRAGCHGATRVAVSHASQGTWHHGLVMTWKEDAGDLSLSDEADEKPLRWWDHAVTTSSWSLVAPTSNTWY